MDAPLNPAVATIMAYARGEQAEPAIIRSVTDLCAVRRYLLDPGAQSTFPRVAQANEFWRSVVNFWEDICLIHDLESPDWLDRRHPAPLAMSMINSYNLPTNDEQEDPQ